jgi:hypothetical protein
LTEPGHAYEDPAAMRRAYDKLVWDSTERDETWEPRLRLTLEPGDPPRDPDR